MPRVLYDQEIEWAAQHHLAGFIVTWPEPLDAKSERAIHVRITELLVEGWTPPPGFARPLPSGPQVPLLPPVSSARLA